MRKKIFPKQFIQTITHDIIANIDSNLGILTILELFEEIPPELRSLVLSSLSTVHDPAIAAFYHVIMLEYGKKYEAQSLRALQKLYMAGVDTPVLDFMPGRFYQAFCTPTRHLGKVNLTVFWEQANDSYQIESFLLYFSPEGIISYVLLENLTLEHLFLGDSVTEAMVRVDYETVRLLLTEAYRYNQICNTAPALGLYLFQRHFLNEAEESQFCAGAVAIRPPLPLRQTVITMFMALQRMDWIYLTTLFDSDYIDCKRLKKVFSFIVQPGTLFLEGTIKEVDQTPEGAVISAYLIVLKDQKVSKSNYVFHLRLLDEYWLIYKIDKKPNYYLKATSRLNPLNLKMYCHTYDIMDMDELITLIGELDKVQEIGEIPNGLHIRISALNDDIEDGVTFMSGVLADLIVNGEEFVIICQDPAILQSLHERCLRLNILNKTGDYHMSLGLVLHYLGGQYARFEDLYMELDYEYLMGSDLRFISVRYLVKNEEAVRRYLLEVLQAKIYFLDADTMLCYHYSAEPAEDNFIAEYILEAEYLTVSGFGSKTAEAIQKQMEQALPEALNFEAPERRTANIFDILTPEVTRRFPLMEEELKRIYLNKWYYSKTPWLNDMSPYEANQTEEGSRLLWSMFKIIQKKINQDYLSGENIKISLKEFMNRLHR